MPAYGGYEREREQTWTQEGAREWEWEQDRERERQVNRHRDGSASPARAPALPGRKPYLYEAPAAASTSAFDAVYGVMGLPSSASSSPVRNTFPPGTGGSSENSSPTARVFRSKSMHYSSSPQPTQGPALQLGQGPPPVCRRRPESIQVIGRGGVGSLVSQWNAQATGGGMSVHRRSFLSAAPSRTTSYDYETPKSPKTSLFDNPPPAVSAAPAQPSTTHIPSPRPLVSLQRTFAALQPKIEAAQYKAEAGLAGRRGFIPSAAHTGEREDVGLMDHTVKPNSTAYASDDMGSAPGIDDAPSPPPSDEEEWQGRPDLMVETTVDYRIDEYNEVQRRANDLIMTFIV